MLWSQAFVLIDQSPTPNSVDSLMRRMSPSRSHDGFRILPEHMHVEIDTDQAE